MAPNNTAPVMTNERTSKEHKRAERDLQFPAVATEPHPIFLEREQRILKHEKGANAFSYSVTVPPYLDPAQLHISSDNGQAARRGTFDAAARRLSFSLEEGHSAVVQFPTIATNEGKPEIVELRVSTKPGQRGYIDVGAVPVFSIVGPAAPVTPSMQEAPGQGTEIGPEQQKVIDLCNVERARYGLPPLTADKDLLVSAQKKAEYLATIRKLWHGKPGCAENIAFNQADSREVMQSWMGSTGHRRNILNPAHRRIGVGLCNIGGGPYWCQQFR